ncbi:hypothetical protein TNCV_500931 [Trichonephila clavipes]|nr:hypothetical protein TNCV_500931 [Trichonephila clavipes]
MLNTTRKQPLGRRQVNTSTVEVVQTQFQEVKAIFIVCTATFHHFLVQSTYVIGHNVIYSPVTYQKPNSIPRSPAHWPAAARPIAMQYTFSMMFQLRRFIYPVTRMPADIS